MSQPKKDSTKSALKGALTALNVGRPLRLPKETFVAPQALAPSATKKEGTWGEEPSQDTKRSQDQVTSRDRIISRGTNIPQDSQHSLHSDTQTQDQVISQDMKVSRDQILSRDRKLPQDTVASQDPIVSQDGARLAVEADPSTLVEPRGQIHRSTNPRKAADQDLATLEYTKVQSGLAKGYTKLPNSILVLIMEGMLRPAEVRILLLIARLTLSYGRAEADVSKRVIEKMTGLQGRVVLEALQGLERQGLIERKQGNAFTSSRARLTDPMVSELIGGASRGLSWGQIQSRDISLSQDTIPPRDAELPQDPFSTSTDVAPNERNDLLKNQPKYAETLRGIAETDSVSIHPSGGQKIPQGTKTSRDSIVNHYKDIKRKREISLSDSLSNSLSGTEIKNYLDQIPLNRKRQSEERELFEILKAYSEGQVAVCLSYVQAKGLGGAGAPCHSPMAYLAKAMGGVLPQATLWAEKRGKEEASKQQDSLAARIASEQEAKAEALERERAERATAEFAKCFATQEAQDEAIKAHVPVGGGGATASPFFRKLAILRWYQTRENSAVAASETDPAIAPKICAVITNEPNSATAAVASSKG